MGRADGQCLAAKGIRDSDPHSFSADAGVHDQPQCLVLKALRRSGNRRLRSCRPGSNPPLAVRCAISSAGAGSADQNKRANQKSTEPDWARELYSERLLLARGIHIASRKFARKIWISRRCAPRDVNNHSSPCTGHSFPGHSFPLHPPVSGHDFSRAVDACNKCWALALASPCLNKSVD